MDKGVRAERTMSETRSYKRLPNVNNPETDVIGMDTSEETHQDKRRSRGLD